jgi:hypothetical protein
VLFRRLAERVDHLVAALLEEFAVLVTGVAQLLAILAHVGEPRLERASI